MKNIFFPAFILTALVAGAQKPEGKAVIADQTQLKEGKVIYDCTIQMQWQFRDANSEFARNAPKSRSETFELMFGNNQSLLQTLPDVNEEARTASGTTNAGGTRTFVTTMGGSASTTYFNGETGKIVSQRELNSKNYLVEEPINKLNWKLSDESKVILGYTARKATALNFTKRTMTSMENGELKRKEVDDTSVVVAWFTTQIPVSAGPNFQGQLPGLILELDINNGRTLYKAVELTAKVNVNSIKEPKGGKRITLEEYREEQKKMMEEMRQRFSQNGGQIRIGGQPQP